jgi:hypothetical protein
VVNAECALAGCVPEARGESDVEVAGVVAQTSVDEDVGPVVVKLELESTAVDGPLGDVTRAKLDIGTYSVMSVNLLRYRA